MDTREIQSIINIAYKDYVEYKVLENLDNPNILVPKIISNSIIGNNSNGTIATYFKLYTKEEFINNIMLRPDFCVEPMFNGYCSNLNKNQLNQWFKYCNSNDMLSLRMDLIKNSIINLFNSFKNLYYNDTHTLKTIFPTIDSTDLEDNHKLLAFICKCEYIVENDTILEKYKGQASFLELKENLLNLKKVLESELAFQYKDTEDMQHILIISEFIYQHINYSLLENIEIYDDMVYLISATCKAFDGYDDAYRETFLAEIKNSLSKNIFDVCTKKEKENFINALKYLEDKVYDIGLNER